MPHFRYTAVDPSGKRITKTMISNSKDEVVAFLASQQFFIVGIEDLTTKGAKPIKHLKTNDKIFFTQNVSVLLSSGISLGEAMAIIAEDTTNKATSAFYRTIQSDLERGYALSKSLAHYPSIFDPVYLSLVEAGENSGKLDVVMANLAKSLEKDARTVNQVRSALLYPGIVLISLVILGSLILFFVLPKVVGVFEELQVQLPLMTRILIWLSDVIIQYPLPILLLVITTIVGGVMAYRHPKTKQFFGQVIIRTPLIKNIVSYLDLTRLSSTLSLLLNAGVPIQQAIKIAAGTVKNPILGREFQATADKLAAGTALGQAMQETSLPRTFVALVTVGERSGHIAAIFETLADHYENRLDTAIKNFTSTLEPVLTLVVGILVGAVVITVMLPIYQFIGNLDAAA